MVTVEEGEAYLYIYSGGQGVASLVEKCCFVKGIFQLVEAELYIYAHTHIIYIIYGTVATVVMTDWNLP